MKKELFEEEHCFIQGSTSKSRHDECLGCTRGSFNIQS